MSFLGCLNTILKDIMTNIIDFKTRAILASKNKKTKEAEADLKDAFESLGISFSYTTVSDDDIFDYLLTGIDYEADIHMLNDIFGVSKEVDEEHLRLKLTLMEEEFMETKVALKDAITDLKANGNISNATHKEILDGLVDQVVIILGISTLLGYDFDGAWDEVLRSNLSKVDPDTGKVSRREDGKVLKGKDFFPPDLEPYIGDDKWEG